MAETLTELVAKITTDASGLKAGLLDAEGAVVKSSKTMQQSFKDIGTSMTNVGKQMSMKLTAPIVGLGTAAFKMSGDFDQSFRKVNVMLGASAEEAVNYKKRILEISSATGKSAGDVADAFYQIVSAGYRGADSLDILETAMKGAVGGAAQTESTMAALTKAMNIFGMEGVGGATKAMDIFFGIVDTGLLSFEQMASAFPQAASSAAGLGVSIEEVGAALGTLSKVTGSTDDAATALNNTFMQLIKPSDKMLELYNEWGVKSGPDAIAKFGGLSGVLAKVAKATGGNVDELAELFPSIRALKALLPLVTTNADDYAAALDTVTNSQGRTSDAFDEMAQGPGFQLQQTFAQIKNAGIKLGDTLASTLSPMLKTLGEKVEGLIQWWQNLDERWQKVIITAAGILAAIGPVLIIFGQMAIGISGLIGLYKTLRIVQLVSTAAQWLWNAALTANPIGVVIMAIAGLVAAGIALYKNWDKVTAFIKGAWHNIKIFFLEGIEKILGALARFTGWIPKFGDSIQKAHDAVSNMIDVEKVKKNLDGYKKALQGAADLLAYEFAPSTEEAKKAIEEQTEAMQEQMGNMRDLTSKTKDYASEQTSILIKAIDDRMKRESSAHDQIMDNLQDEYDATLKNIDSGLDATLKGFQDEIDIIDAQMEATADAERDQQDIKRKAELEEAKRNASTAEEWKRAKENLAEFLEDLEARRIREGLEDEKDALRQKMDLARNEAQTSKDLALKAYDFEQGLQKKGFDTVISQLNAQKVSLDTALAEKLQRYDDDEKSFAKMLGVETKGMLDFVTEYNELINQLQNKVVTITTVHQDIYTSGGQGVSVPEGPWPSPTPSPTPPSASGGEAPPPFWALQHGGIVKQPIFAKVAEAGPEAVIPLDKLGGMAGGGGIHIYFNDPVFMENEQSINKLAKKIQARINREQRLGFGAAYSG